MQRNTPGVTGITNSFKMGIPYTTASNLTYLVHPGQVLVCQNVPWDPLNAKKKIMFLKHYPVWAMWKCMVAMATCNAILNNGGIPTKSIISQLLLTIDY